MARDRVVEPKTERLYISDGDYLDVKKKLNHGEHDDYLSRLSPFMSPGEPIRMETRQVRTGKVLAYLLGWSLTHRGAPIPMSVDMPDNARLAALNSLDQDTFMELYEAVNAHEDRVKAETAAIKNGPDGASVSSAISPSLVLATGESNGSESSV